MVNNFMRTGFLTCLLAGTTAVQGAVTHPLDEKKVLEVRVSQENLTRIKVEDDRILHVFGMAGEYVLEVDEDQGQIFIRPTDMRDPTFSRASSKPISLTLTTEGGHTQDLRLIPTSQAPEALILQVNTEISKEIEREKHASAPLFREEIEGLIEACRIGRIPLGYKEMPLNLSTLQEPYLLVREIQSQKLRGLTYRVHNNTQELMVLSEPEFAESLFVRQSFQATPKGFAVASNEGGFLKPHGLVALLIPKKTLNPGEGTDVYVVARAN